MYGVLHYGWVAKAMALVSCMDGSIRDWLGTNGSGMKCVGND